MFLIQGRGVLTAAFRFFPRQACDSMWSWATATVGRRSCSPLLRPPPPRELNWPPVRARSKAGGPAHRRVGDTPQPRRFAEFAIDYKPAMLQRSTWQRSRDTRGIDYVPYDNDAEARRTISFSLYVPRMWKRNGAGEKEEEALPPPSPSTASCSLVVGILPRT